MSDALARAWARLMTVTPLKGDCGALCGAACCAPDEDGQGAVQLFPGERALIGAVDWARFEETDALCTLLCEGRCEREKRPFGCRMFPLTPVRRRGTWDVRLDRRAWAMCPLMGSGIMGLAPEFVEAVREAVRVLAADADMEPFLRAWARQERAYRTQLTEEG